MKPNTIIKDNIHFTNKIEHDKIIVSADNQSDEELSRFWLERGSMHIEITDTYQNLYYKNRGKKCGTKY